MKQCMMVLAVLLLAVSPVHADTSIFDPIPFPVEVIQVPDDIIFPLETYELTVHIQGSGNVESSPEGLDCTSDSLGDTETCTYQFVSGSAVALTATPVSGDNFTAQFGEWSGACSGSGACPLIMNDDKEVTAHFTALGTPVFALPVPSAQETFSYHPAEVPYKNPDPSLCKPFAIGASYFSDGITPQVGLPPFGGDVDVYLGVQMPDSPEILLVGADDATITPLSAGIIPWREDVSFQNLDVGLFGTIPPGSLTPGTYRLYLMVTPADSMDSFYLWQSYFELW